MQLAHPKTSPVVVLGPLELLELANETVAVSQHHQFSLTIERPLSTEFSNFVILRIQHCECSLPLLKSPQ